MSDFKAIETQEQLDEIIKERLARAKESTKKDFEGWISPEDFEKKVQELKTDNENLKNSLAESNEKLKGFNDQLSERDAKLKEYEISSVKTKVAAELGLDFKLASRISGETEEDIRKDAESLKELFKPQFTAPMHFNESVTDSENAAYLQMLHNMKGE